MFTTIIVPSDALYSVLILSRLNRTIANFSYLSEAKQDTQAWSRCFYRVFGAAGALQVDTDYSIVYQKYQLVMII